VDAIMLNGISIDDTSDSPETVNADVSRHFWGDEAVLLRKL
jgi:hypothetical protein